MKKLLSIIAITVFVVACSSVPSRHAYMVEIEGGWPIKAFDYENRPFTAGDSVFVHYTSYDGQWDILNDVVLVDTTYSESAVYNNREIKVLHKYRKGIINKQIAHKDF